MRNPQILRLIALKNKYVRIIRGARDVKVVCVSKDGSWAITEYKGGSYNLPPLKDGCYCVFLLLCIFS